MKKKLLAFAAILVFHAGAIAADFVDDVKQFRATNKDASADISEIAKKYIAVGQTKEMVERYLTAQKFSLNYQPIAADQSQTLVATHVEKSLAGSIGFHDELRVIVVFENGLARSVSSKLIYRAL
ncbi:MAG TPA: hypothetical protein VGD52_10395 [Pseudoduganella sp.]